LKPVCVGCKLFFRITRNGYAFEEGMPVGAPTKANLCARPGCNEPEDQHPGPGRPADPPGCDEFVQRRLRDRYEAWAPYKLWIGDLYTCPGCNAQIVVGVPYAPLAEHYQTELYAQRLQTHPPQIRINDC
jgi:hypothetical protein